MGKLSYMLWAAAGGLVLLFGFIYILESNKIKGTSFSTEAMHSNGGAYIKESKSAPSTEAKHTAAGDQLEKPKVPIKEVHPPAPVKPKAAASSKTSSNRVNEETKQAAVKLKPKSQSKQKPKSYPKSKPKETQKPKPDKTVSSVPNTTSKKRTVYLTFDDGPNNNTQRLLNVLDSYHVKATFFMLNDNMLYQQKAVKKMAKEGFGIGCHGVTHQVKKFYHSPSSAYGEMSKCLATMKKITNKSSIMIRTPYGSKPYMTAPFRKVMDQHGYHMWDWNVDSLDWKFLNGPKTSAYTIKQIQSLRKRGVTPVILMHDKPSTTDAIPTVIRYLKANGYQIKAMTNSQIPLNFWNHHSL